MDAGEIRTLLRYNDWANRRILEACSRLSSDQFTRDCRASHASVRGTLVHLIGGHWVWLRFWLGEPTEQIAARCDTLWNEKVFPDIASLEAAHQKITDDQVQFLETVSEDRLNSRIRFQSFQGHEREMSLTQMIQHVVNHSTYHRGQVVTLLRQEGFTPPGTDFSTFLEEELLTRSAV
jgi:uncharacterized damage-inducible protein DinB